MGKISATAVAAAAYMGGFRGNEIPTAVAVAYGESNFDTHAENACCTGLFQIHRKAHAKLIGDKNLKDPIVNAKLAHQIWAGDWCGGRAPNGHCQKWEAYGLDNAGKTWSEKMKIGVKAYQELQTAMNAGQDPLTIVGEGGFGPELPGPEDVPGLSELADTASAIAGVGKAVLDVLNRLGGWISDPNNWLRVAEVVGGGLLIVLGLRITFNAQINAVGGKIVQTVVPGGKAGAAAAAKKTIQGRA